MTSDRHLPPGRWGLGVTNCRPWKEVVDNVRDAESMGADVAFVAEDVNCRDTFELLVLAATGTERIRLSTGVINPYTRNPTSIAMALATLDEISGGRAQLGMGTSSPSLIETQMGIQVGQAVAVMREATEIVRALLAGDTVTYGGQRFRYVDAHLEVRTTQERIPVYFAAMGPLTLRLAGRIADGVLLNVGTSPSYIRWALSQIDVGLRETGRTRDSFTVAAWISAYVTDDRESALRRARVWLAGVLSVPRQGELLLKHAGLDTSILAPIRERFSAYPDRGDRKAAAEFVPQKVVEELTVVGGPGDAAARIEDYRDAGVDLPVVGIGALRALAARK